MSSTFDTETFGQISNFKVTWRHSLASGLLWLSVNSTPLQFMELCLGQCYLGFPVTRWLSILTQMPVCRISIAEVAFKLKVGQIPPASKVYDLGNLSSLPLFLVKRNSLVTFLVLGQILLDTVRKQCLTQHSDSWSICCRMLFWKLTMRIFLSIL